MELEASRAIPGWCAGLGRFCGHLGAGFGQVRGRELATGCANRVDVHHGLGLPHNTFVTVVGKFHENVGGSGNFLTEKVNV